jgi:hypothetical protein
MSGKKRKQMSVEESVAKAFGADTPSIRSQVTKFFTGEDDEEEKRRKAAAKQRAAKRQ